MRDSVKSTYSKQRNTQLLLPSAKFVKIVTIGKNKKQVPSTMVIGSVFPSVRCALFGNKSPHPNIDRVSGNVKHNLQIGKLYNFTAAVAVPKVS